VEQRAPQPEKPKKTIPERISHAWQPLKDSFSVQLFSAATVLEIIGFVFEWHKKLEEARLWPEWAPALNVSIYGVLTLLCARAIFLLAEKNGELREELTSALGLIESNTTAIATIHDIIHETRDSLLANNSFLAFLVSSEDEGSKPLFEIWAAQLGIIQKGMRSLTGSDCNICIKLIKKEAFDKGVDGLVTVCYSPAVSIERRQKSCILPTNQGIAQEAIVTKSLAFCNDILTDDRFWPRDRKEQCALQYRTVLAAPIIVDRSVRGVLCFDWSKPNQYAASHRHAVACFTDMVSTACYFSDLGRKLITEYKPKV